jgi:DNA-binding transcriptional MerR regulator
MKPPFTTADASRALEVSPRRVQQLEATGVLAAVRTSSGQRLFDPDDVEALRVKRATHNKHQKKVVQ